MTYWKLIVTDQSYEVSCLDLKFFPGPMRFSCPTQGWYRKNKSIRENWQVKMFAVAGYHAVVCDAFIFLSKCTTLDPSLVPFSSVKPDVSQPEVTYHNGVRLATVYRRIYCRKVLMLSKKTS